MKTILFQLTFLFCLLPLYSNTFTLSGKVVDNNSGTPIPYACVYIANTTIGTYTNDRGEFHLSFSQGGMSNLVVSHVSYQTFVKNISFHGDSLYIVVGLKALVYEMKAVNILEKDPDREYKFKLITMGLLGMSKNASSCEIENRETLRIMGSIRNENWSLKLIADSMVVIKNKALGYTIKYDLVYFEENEHNIAFFGYPFFEDWISNGKYPNRFIKARRIAYEGSKMHFFRSLYEHRLAEEGFEVYRLSPCMRDSNKAFIFGLLENPAFTGDSGVGLQQTYQPLDLYSYVTMDSLSGAKVLAIREPFEVRYTGRKEEESYNSCYEYYAGLRRIKNTQTSIARVIHDNLRFYSNGSMEKPYELNTIGYWSYKQLADMLPYNFRYFTATAGY